MGVKRFGVRRDKEVREMGRLVSLRINASYTKVETRLPFVFPFVTLRPPILNSAFMWTGNLCITSGYLNCCSAAGLVPFYRLGHYYTTWVMLKHLGL